MFESINPKKTYEEIIDQIQGMIMDGTLKRGDKLPAERKLVEQLNVSRASLREALKALEVLGLIESKHGEGSYIANNVGSTILKSISVAYKLNNGTVEDIMEIRECLEIQACRTSALKATDSQIKELEKIVDKMAESNLEQERLYLDIEFHNKLISIMDNVIFEIISDSISNLMFPFIRDVRRLYNEEDEDLKIYYFVEQHRNIIKAIKERDPQKAVEAIMEHIRLTEDDIIELSKKKQL